MRNTRLDDGNAGLRQPILDLFAQRLRDLFRIAAQSEAAVIIVRFIGIRRAEISQRRLALDLDEVHVVIDFEQRLGRVDHLPDHDGRDLDRAAVGVVHLELAALEVAHPHGYGRLGVEGIGPAQSRVVAGANVLAEELQNLGFIGMDHEQPCPADQHDDRHQQVADDAADPLRPDGAEQQVTETKLCNGENHQGQITGSNFAFDLLDHRLLLSSFCHPF